MGFIAIGLLARQEREKSRSRKN